MYFKHIRQENPIRMTAEIFRIQGFFICIGRKHKNPNAIVFTLALGAAPPVVRRR